MGVKTEIMDDKVKIAVTSTLGNDIHKEFRRAYEDNSSPSYVVDLANSSNIDSAGLGMLLLMRDFTGGEESNIEIINCSDHILDIFHVTCFYKLFNIPQYVPRADKK